MRNITASLLHMAWIQDEKNTLDEAITFVESYAGPNFLLDAAIFLYKFLKVDYILIAVVEPEPQLLVKSKVFLKDGEILPNIQYLLAGSPCEQVYDKEQNYFPHGIQEMFPQNALLKQLQVKSYLGIPLFDNDEKGLGCLALLHHNIIDSGGYVEALINVLLPRLEEEIAYT